MGPAVNKLEKHILFLLRALGSSHLQAASLTESVRNFRDVLQECPADNVAQVGKVNTWIAEQLGSENTSPFNTVGAEDTGRVREPDVPTLRSQWDMHGQAFFLTRLTAKNNRPDEQVAQVSNERASNVHPARQAAI